MSLMREVGAGWKNEASQNVGQRVGAAAPYWTVVHCDDYHRQKAETDSEHRRADAHEAGQDDFQRNENGGNNELFSVCSFSFH